MGKRKGHLSKSGKPKDGRSALDIKVKAAVQEFHARQAEAEKTGEAPEGLELRVVGTMLQYP